MEVPATEKGSLGSQDGKAEELSAVLAFDSRCFLRDDRRHFSAAHITYVRNDVSEKRYDHDLQS